MLKFSAPTAVVVLDDDNAMAVCSFDQDAHPMLAMTPAGGIGKLSINAAIQSYASNPNGWTSIGEGAAFAHDLLSPVTGYDVKAMVVRGALTLNRDGESRTYKPGEIFTMPRGCMHYESYGPEGAVVLSGRRT